MVDRRKWISAVSSTSHRSPSSAGLPAPNRGSPGHRCDGLVLTPWGVLFARDDREYGVAPWACAAGGKQKDAS